MQDPTCLLSSQNAFHKEKAYITVCIYVYVCKNRQNLLRLTYWRGTLTLIFYTTFQDSRGQLFTPLVTIIK